MKKVMKKIYILSSIGVLLMGLTVIFAFKNTADSVIDKGYAIGDVVNDFKLRSTSGGITSMAENRSAKGCGSDAWWRSWITFQSNHIIKKENIN